VKKWVKRVPEPAPAVVPAPKKMMKKIGRAVEPVVDLIQAEQAQGQIGEAVPIERGNRFMDMFQMAGGIPTSQYLNLSELPGLATSTPELATTIRALPEGLVKPSTSLADIVPPLVKKLKVGDVLQYEHNWENRNGYQRITVPITAINKDHTVFTVDVLSEYDRYHGHTKPRLKKVKLQLNAQGDVVLNGDKQDWRVPGAKVGKLYASQAEFDKYNQLLYDYFHSVKR
jgi:hypothetical protein